MKRVLLLLTMVLAFSLSNAQSNDIYVQGGINLNSVAESSRPIVNAGIGYQINRVDLTATFARRWNTKYSKDISVGAAYVIGDLQGASVGIGAIVGNLFNGSQEGIKNTYYAPEVSLRLVPNNSKVIRVIFLANLPQATDNDFGSGFNWTPEVGAKLRFNIL